MRSGTDVQAVLDRVLVLVAEVDKAASSDTVLQEEVAPLSKAVETAVSTKRPSLISIREALRGLGNVLAAGNHLTAIATRIPALLDEIEKLIPA
jgi:hypothetical protein